MHPQEFTETRKASQVPADDEMLLTSKQTRARVGDVSTMCIWRWMRDPRVRFPAPIKINGRNYWRLGVLRRWDAERMARDAA
jgi:predicted DNA-binding transcriptional regulator AlpA